jgi:hypothetical protein
MTYVANGIIQSVLFNNFFILNISKYQKLYYSCIPKVNNVFDVYK